MSIFSQTSPALPWSPELRRSRRYQISDEPLEVSWLDHRGRIKTARAKVVNVSENGIALRIPEAVLPFAVRFKSARLNLDGLGSVRHCCRAGFKYVVGLEFGVYVRWQAPQGEVREPITLCSP